MKETPILYSTPMVRAVLDLTKTETRRLRGLEFINWNPNLWRFDKKAEAGEAFPDQYWFEELDEHGQPKEKYRLIKCPYGKPGDVLWVRETFCDTKTQEYLHKHTNLPYWYKADVVDTEICKQVMKEHGWKFSPSIHMPKSAARIWLQVLEIKAERLQDITEEDAKREGVEFIRGNGGLGYKSYLNEGQLTNLATLSFQTLWKSINGEDSWEKNPFVWVIKFKVLSTTGKPDFK